MIPSRDRSTRGRLSWGPTAKSPNAMKVPGHQARACLATKWLGRPRNTSEGKYRRCSLHNGQVTAIDLNGNSFTPEGTSWRQSLQVTMNCLRSCITNPTVAAVLANA